jgi:hypothetical protein
VSHKEAQKAQNKTPAATIAAGVLKGVTERS